MNIFPSRYVSVGVVSLGHYFFVSFFFGWVAYLFDILLEFFLKLSKFGLNRHVDGEVQVKFIVTGFYFNEFVLNTWDFKISFQYHVVNETI